MIYKYQETFAKELANSWLNGNKSDVRTKIRNLKNKAQAAYIASAVVLCLMDCALPYSASEFVAFIHPNN